MLLLLLRSLPPRLPLTPSQQDRFRFHPASANVGRFIPKQRSLLASARLHVLRCIFWVKIRAKWACLKIPIYSELVDLNKVFAHVMLNFSWILAGWGYFRTAGCQLQVQGKWKLVPEWYGSNLSRDLNSFPFPSFLSTKLRSCCRRTDYRTERASERKIKREQSGENFFRFFFGLSLFSTAGFSAWAWNFLAL